MPKEITDAKKFLSLIKPEKQGEAKKGKDEKPAKKTLFIKKNPKITKFKIRKGKYIYTFKTDKAETVKRLTEGLDSNIIEKVEIKKRRVLSKKAKK